MLARKSLFSSPGRTILLSFSVTIFIGTLLLSCSWAHNGTLTLLDSLFTATSATCVTGLLTVPMSTFTALGQCIIMCLMQIGALGLITLTVFMLSLFVKLGLHTNSMTGQILELEGGPRRASDMLVFIITFTCAIEFIGFIATLITIKNYYPWGKAIFYALFHSISSFCNAGFVIFQRADHAYPLIAHPGLMVVTALLVLVGGLGFIVWNEVVRYLKSFNKHKHVHFSLHSKIVFSMTLALVSFMSCVVFLLEYLPEFIEQPSLKLIIASIFDGVCLRSAGFSSLSFSAIHLATLFAVMLVSFIGSSPGSTGSGIKTTTFAVFLAAIKATLSRRAWVEIKQRTIPNDQVFKAMAIFCLSLCIVAITIFLLLLTEEGWRFIDIMSEAFAAFTNLGLSTGITPYLSAQGKILIINAMLIGRIGSLTLLLAFRRQHAKSEFHYPEERILMG